MTRDEAIKIYRTYDNISSPREMEDNLTLWKELGMLKLDGPPDVKALISEANIEVSPYRALEISSASVAKLADLVWRLKNELAKRI